MKRQINNFLVPLFSGFYGTIWGTDSIDLGVAFDGEEPEDAWDRFDSVSYRNDTAKEFAYYICGYISEALGFDDKITIKDTKVSSPREYNFYNDQIYGILNIENYDKFEFLVNKYICDHRKRFVDTAKKEFTSYDGFISFRNDDFNECDWRNDDFYLSWVLEKILIDKYGEEVEYSLYEDVRGNGVYPEGYFTLTPTHIYNDIYFGDHVKCNNCGTVMLLPCGADKCPECGKTGCMEWVDDDKQEENYMNIKDISFINRSLEK